MAEPDLTLPRTAELLEAEIEEGLFTRGAQVAVDLRRHRDRARSSSATTGGAGRSSPTRVFRVYCTIKPVTVLAVARLVDDGTLDLDEPLRERLPSYRVLADGAVTLRRVINHTAGLHRPMAIELELMPPDKRVELLEQFERPVGFTVGRRRGRTASGSAGTCSVACSRRVTGEPLREHLRRVVIEPLGMTDTWIGMTKDEYRDVIDRLGVNHDLRSMQPYPLLLERGVRMCTEVNPAHGGYSTAVDLCRLYAAVVAQLDGRRLRPTCPRPRCCARSRRAPGRPTYDRVLDRVCEHGLGFMTALAEHAFGRHCSPRSFGHSGNVGSSFAWADPDDGPGRGGRVQRGRRSRVGLPATPVGRARRSSPTSRSTTRRSPRRATTAEEPPQRRWFRRG